MPEHKHKTGIRLTFLITSEGKVLFSEIFTIYFSQLSDADDYLSNLIEMKNLLLEDFSPALVDYLKGIKDYTAMMEVFILSGCIGDACLPEDHGTSVLPPMLLSVDVLNRIDEFREATIVLLNEYDYGTDAVATLDDLYATTVSNAVFLAYILADGILHGITMDVDDPGVVPGTSDYQPFSLN